MVFEIGLTLKDESFAFLCLVGVIFLAFLVFERLEIGRRYDCFEIVLAVVVEDDVFDVRSDVAAIFVIF